MVKSGVDFLAYTVSVSGSKRPCSSSFHEFSRVFRVGHHRIMGSAKEQAWTKEFGASLTRSERGLAYSRCLDACNKTKGNLSKFSRRDLEMKETSIAPGLRVKQCVPFDSEIVSDTPVTPGDEELRQERTG